MRPELARIGLVLALALLLAACGFQLRGSVAWPPSLTPLHVDGAGLTPEFERFLVPALRRAGADVTTGTGDAAARPRLEIVRVDDTRDLTALGAGSTTREFTLSYAITYRLHRTPGDTPGENRVSAQRDLRVRAEEVNAAIADARRINDELRGEAIAALLRRLVAAGG